MELITKEFDLGKKILEVKDSYNNLKEMWRNEFTNLKYHTILKKCRELNIPVSSSRGGGFNRIPIYCNFFDGSEKSEYFLGLIAADGNVATGENAISLHLKDLDLLTEYRDYLNPSIKIHTHINAAGSTMGVVIFSSKEVKQQFLDCGIVNNKTYSLDYYREFTWHFVRGYFDGDGWVSKTGNKAKFTGACGYFLQKLIYFLEQEGLYVSATLKGENKNIADIYINSTEVQLFKDKMYKDSSIYLKRKFERFSGRSISDN